MHINSAVRAPDLGSLFTTVDVTKKIQPEREKLRPKINELHNMLTQSHAPQREIGPHCDSPYECPFKAHCWKKVPDKSIFEIPSIGEKVWELYQQGIASISDPRFIPTRSQENRVKAVRQNRRWIDSDRIKKLMEPFRWPLYFLDFETVGHEIPVYIGTRPFEQVPFQFSCLFQREPGGVLEEVCYLHDERSDPRPQLTEKLLAALPGHHPIVAYNKDFEAECIRGLAEFDSARRKELLALNDRLIDPLPIFRQAVYDPAFRGSFSLKAVTPAILGPEFEYSAMEICDGQAAQRAFAELVAAETTAERRAKLIKQMIEYCRRDTEATARLVGWLGGGLISPRSLNGSAND